MHNAGMRMALGAQGRQILALFVGRGSIVVGAGVALGLAGAFAFTQLMRGLYSASAHTTQRLLSLSLSC